jgi:hypothetical protein
VDIDRERSDRFAVRVMAQVRDYVRNAEDKAAALDEAIAGIIIALAKLTDQDEVELGDRIFGDD